MGWNGRRVLFFGAVDFGGDEEAVPVDELGRVGVVDDVDGDGLALLHAENRAGRCAVVADGGEDAVRREFDSDGRDAEGDVGRVGCPRLGLAGVGAREHDHLAQQGARAARQRRGLRARV